MQFAYLPGSLSADIHVTSRLQGAQRGHAAFDIVARDADSAQRVASGGQSFPGEQGTQAEQAEPTEQQAALVRRTSHAGFQPMGLGRGVTLSAYTTDTEGFL
ncbi:hypothetical protein D3C78_1314480 [compost metagenome]